MPNVIAFFQLHFAAYAFSIVPKSSYLRINGIISPKKLSQNAQSLTRLLTSSPSKAEKVTSVIYNFIIHQFKANKTPTTKTSVPGLVILT